MGKDGWEVRELKDSKSGKYRVYAVQYGNGKILKKRLLRESDKPQSELGKLIDISKESEVVVDDTSEAMRLHKGRESKFDIEGLDTPDPELIEYQRDRFKGSKEYKNRYPEKWDDNKRRINKKLEKQNEDLMKELNLLKKTSDPKEKEMVRERLRKLKEEASDSQRKASYFQ